MGQRRRVGITEDARAELRRLDSVQPAEWRRMVRTISEHPKIGLKVCEMGGRDVRRKVLDKSKVLVYYLDTETPLLLIFSVLHGSAERRPLEE